MSYHITRENNSEDKEHINNQLFYFNLAHFPEDLRGRYEQISLFLKDENGLVRGGF